MKLVRSMSGAVAARLQIEDVTPAKNVPLQDLLNALSERYEFMAMSELSGPPPIVLQNGKLGDGTVISQLQLMQGGYVLFAEDTLLAQIILKDIMNFLTEKFEYNFESRVGKISCLSSVVVEFDDKKQNVLSSLYAIEKVVASKAASPAILKRLLFGRPDEDLGYPAPRQLTPFEAIEQADFTIERRLGSKPEHNRFFCIAPLPTDEHVATLEEIEALIPINAFD